jgi:hypothetical protein
MQACFELREVGCAHERSYCKRLINKTLVQASQRCRKPKVFKRPG